MGMRGVYLPDSWVLAVETDSTKVCFVLEAVLMPEHPRYAPPSPASNTPTPACVGAFRERCIGTTDRTWFARPRMRRASWTTGTSMLGSRSLESITWKAISVW